jgi:hypothetical protein
MIATDGDTSALWERPGGHLLRQIYGPWRASLAPDQAGDLDGFLQRRLPYVVERLDRWIIETTVDTTTADGQERMDRRVLRALAIRPGATVRGLRPFAGGRYMQIRLSLDRMIGQRKVAWRNGGYWLAERRHELGYAGLEGSTGRAEFDRLVLAAVVGSPKGATLNELWIDVPGSRARLRASLARLLNREAIAWKMSSGITRYFPVSEEDAP